MAQRGSQHLVSGFHQLGAPWAFSLKRTPRHQTRLQQQQVKVQQQTSAQVAAYPAFIDDNRPTGGGGGAVAAGPAELPPAQQQQQQQPQPQPRPLQQLQGGQQQQEQQQQHGWFAQTPWGSTPQQPQQQQARQQRQLQEQVHINMTAALQVQQGQQQQEQQSSGDALITQLQQCADLASVAALVSCQQREQQLTLPQACAALQQLCRVAPVSTLTSRQQQQVQQCCAAAAHSALQNLQQLGHTDLGQLLAMFQVLGFKPEGAWVRSVLQQAGTELVHYSPAELALLLLTATHASARCGVIPGPDTPVVQLLPSRRVPQPSSLDALTASSTTARHHQQLQEQQQQQQQRRANTVLTSAWLQHFLSTFQPYIACRSAHPQLSPGHMEAVITCLAALRVAPDRFWMYLFVRQMSAQLPHCSPGSVVRMLGALATLGYRLPDHVLLQVERQIGTAAAMVQLRAEECVEVVRSVAVLRAQLTKPSEAWLQQLLAAAVKGSRHLSASAVIGLLAGTAALGLQLDPSWMDVLMMQARAALSAMTPHEHVSLIDALSQQQHQYRPGPVFMSMYLSQVAAHLPELSISQQAVLATGLATVGYKPGSAWMAAFMMQLLEQPVTGADGEHLLQLLRALRRMQYVPAPNVAQQLSGLIDSIQLSVPYNQLLLLREALDELQYQRGIMAVPGGPRRAAEAAAAAAAAAAVAAPQAVEGAGGVPASLEVAAVEGVVSAAATEKLLARSAAGAAGLAEQAVQAGGSGGEAVATAALDAAAGRQVPAPAVLSTAVDAAAGASGEPQGPDQAGSAAGDGAVTAQGMEGNNAGSSSSSGTTAPVGVAQQSLELFA